MSGTHTNSLKLPFLQPAQALKTITHNEALQRLDAGLYLSCSDMSAEALPEAPTEGQTLVISAQAAQDVGREAGDIAVFQNGLWVWFTPTAGWTVWDATAASLRIFDGQMWTAPTQTPVFDTLPSIGLNTSASPQQRLAVASETSLFTHDGQSHRMNVNRASETDTASLIFQTAYAGNAEFGVTGTEGMSLKTRSDDGIWQTRLNAPDTGAGILSPSFSSVTVSVETDSAVLVPTGLFALTGFASLEHPQGNLSGLLAYDTGLTPSLVSLAVTARLENHASTALDGSLSASGNIGLSAVEGGLYIENRIGKSRQFNIVFLC